MNFQEKTISELITLDEYLKEIIKAKVPNPINILKFDRREIKEIINSKGNEMYEEYKKENLL